MTSGPAHWEMFDKVEQAKQEWEATLDALPQLICVVNARGQVLRANRTLEAWNLGTVTTVKGCNLHSLLHPCCTDTACVLGSFLHWALATAQPAQIETNDPHLGRHLQIKIQPVEGQQRLAEQTSAVIVHDITQRKATEEWLRQSNDALQRALQAKQEMLRSVSHELRTPLTLIQGYAHLLRNEVLGPLTDKQREALEVLTQRSEYLQSMIERLLLLQSLEDDQIHLFQCQIVHLLQQNAEDWQARAADHNIQICVEEPAAELPLVHVNPDLLRHVFDNLLENAIKFSSDGTAIQISFWATESEVMIAICDQGIGIPLHQQEDIFDSFHQIDGAPTRMIGGMGIGLTLCRKIINAHHGRIWAVSDGEKQGSTFYIALPAVKV